MWMDDTISLQMQIPPVPIEAFAGQKMMIKTDYSMKILMTIWMATAIYVT